MVVVFRGEPFKTQRQNSRVGAVSSALPMKTATTATPHRYALQDRFKQPRLEQCTTLLLK